MFTLPCLFWRFLNRRSGLNLSVIMEASMATQHASYADNREKTLRYTVHLIDRFLLFQRDTRSGCMVRIKHILSRYCFLFYGKLYGNYLTFSYVMIKTLYVINSIGQLFLLDVILGYEYHALGITVVRHLLMGTDWSQSDRFPRVTLCDFSIRQNTNVHRYTFQCVLPINLFNEKIFVLVWFWLLFIAIVTTISLFQWLLRSVPWPPQVKFVRHQLRAMEACQRDNSVIRKFTEHYLRRDGMFLLRLVSKNAGDLVAMELLGGLWGNYGPRQRMVAEGAPNGRAGHSSRSHVPRHTKRTTDSTIVKIEEV